MSGQQHAPAALYHPGKTRYLLYRWLGGPQGRSGRAENLVPTRIRSPDRPAHSSVAIPTEIPGPPLRYSSLKIHTLFYYFARVYVLPLLTRFLTSADEQNAQFFSTHTHTSYHVSVGRAVFQEVCRRHLTPMNRFQSQANPYQICPSCKWL